MGKYFKVPNNKYPRRSKGIMFKAQHNILRNNHPVSNRVAQVCKNLDTFQRPMQSNPEGIKGRKVNTIWVGRLDRTESIVPGPGTLRRSRALLRANASLKISKTCFRTTLVMMVYRNLNSFFLLTKNIA